jgi:long-subunit fatty acid transport protein
MARFTLMALVVISSVGAWASEGVFLLGNDALQLGRASSGVASPRSAYWSYMNPASMVDLERRFDINMYTVFTDVDLHPKGLIANPFDGALESNKEAFIASSGFIYPLSVGTLGGGFFVPSGSGVDFDHSRNWISRIFGGNTDRRLDYQHIRGVLSYAYELDNGWALGVSLHGSVNRFRSDHITLNFQPTSGDMDWGTAYGAGFGLGLYKRWEQWAVGVGYSSRHWVQAQDKYADLMAAPLDTPHIIQAGVAYTIHPKVELTLDYKWLNWEGIPQYGSALLDGGGFNWRDQHGVKFGVEWKAFEKWTFYGGYAYTNTPISDDHVLLSGLVPVTVEQHWTAGVTHKINEQNEVHLVGVYAPSHKLTDTGEGKLDCFSWFGKGSTLEASALSVLLGYSYKW